MLKAARVPSTGIRPGRRSSGEALALDAPTVCASRGKGEQLSACAPAVLCAPRSTKTGARMSASRARDRFPHMHFPKLRFSAFFARSSAKFGRVRDFSRERLSSAVAGASASGARALDAYMFALPWTHVDLIVFKIIFELWCTANTSEEIK